MWRLHYLLQLVTQAHSALGRNETLIATSLDLASQIYLLSTYIAG